MGFCAEHSAIAQMITNEESRIIKIVAVGAEGKYYHHAVDVENLFIKLIMKILTQKY